MSAARAKLGKNVRRLSNCVLGRAWRGPNSSFPSLVQTLGAHMMESAGGSRLVEPKEHCEKK